MIKVPLQAVVGVDDRQFCFIEEDGETRPVEVEIGLFDSDFVEIKTGLTEGDFVSLVPPSSRDFIPEKMATETGKDNSELDDHLLSARN